MLSSGPNRGRSFDHHFPAGPTFAQDFVCGPWVAPRIFRSVVWVIRGALGLAQTRWPQEGGKKAAKSIPVTGVAADFSDDIDVIENCISEAFLTAGRWASEHADLAKL